MRTYKIMYIKIVLFLITVIPFVGCNSVTENTNDETEKAEYLKISKAQFENEKMQVGNPQLTDFQITQACTGVVEPTIDGKAYLSVPVSGKVESIFVSVGSTVKKGQVLFAISSMVFIDLQQNYLESKAKLEYLSTEYKRKKELVEAQIEAGKEFKRTESEYESLKAKVAALKLQLETLNLAVDKLNSGTIKKQVVVRAEMDGIITAIHVNNGEHVEPNNYLAEILNSKNMQIKLAVFPDPDMIIQLGQKVIVSVNQKLNYETTISRINPMIDTDSKTMYAYANLATNMDVVSGSFVSAKIVKSKRQSMALPTKALQKESGRYFIYAIVEDKGDYYQVEKKPVKTGVQNEEFTEVLNAAELKNSIIAGGYNIN